MLIELTDNQAAMLKARAAAQGLGLHAWLSQLAQEESLPRRRKSAYGLLAEFGPGPTADEIDENRRDLFRGFAEEFE